MTGRRRFNAALLGGLLAPLAAYAQQPDKVYRIAIFGAGNNPRSAPFYVAFEKRLRELGWIDGKNLEIEFATAQTNDQLAALAAKLVARRVDLMVTIGPEPGLQAAHAATGTIPIVMVALNFDPVEKKYVASLAHPGGNITGVYFRNGEVGAKQLELLRAALPAATRVGVLWSRYSADQLPPVEAEAAQLGMRLDKVELTAAVDVESTLAALKARRAEAVLALGDPIVYLQRERIVSGALRQQLPLVAGLTFGELGALLAFGPDLDAALRSGAQYVDKILRGAQPADMPIDQPTKFSLVLNLKTANALGLSIPQSLLLRADEVVRR